MRKILMMILLSCGLCASCFAKGPVGDWQIVQQDIPRGWQITVVTSFTFPCVFQQATDQELICEPLDHDGRASDKGEIRVRRGRILEIRVEKREGANMLAGAGGAAALGSLLGALLIPGARGPSAYLFGLGGASIGASSSRGTHILHGKVIYRRRVADKDTIEGQPARSGIERQ